MKGKMERKIRSLPRRTHNKRLTELFQGRKKALPDTGSNESGNRKSQFSAQF